MYIKFAKLIMLDASAISSDVFLYKIYLSDNPFLVFVFFYTLINK